MNEPIVKTTEAVELKGPNRDRGRLISFAIKGDLNYRILTQIETEDQALIITLPEDTARKVGYELVREIEARDLERRPNTAVKADE